MGVAMGVVKIDPALMALRRWAVAHNRANLAAPCNRLAAQSPVGRWRALAGPTGEANLYAVLPRNRVLCLAQGEVDRDACLLLQLAAVLAVGSRALWTVDERPLWEILPPPVKDRVALVKDWTRESVSFDAVLHHGAPAALLAVCRAVAARPGPIVGVIGLGLGAGIDAGDIDIPLERLVLERSLSVNTAAGGNASLMTLGMA